MDDYLPGPSSMAPQDLPGPAASSRRPCDDCRGRGNLPSGHRCPVCEGEGWRKATVREQRRDGWDEYVEAPVAEAVQPQLSAGTDRAAEIRRLDASIARIQRTLDQKAGRDVVLPFQWEALQAHYERSGSYAELRRALGVLRAKAPDVYAAVRRRYVIQIVEPTRHDRALEAVGVAFLASEMKHIRVPAWLEQEEGRRRNETIESLAAQGMTAGAIGRRLKLPKDRVRQALRKLQQRRERPPGPVESGASGSPP